MKFARILAWAVFLGASWTWCIGMYLPALLLRDYGIWALVVFAVPNVIGAAAMAWVLPDAQASRALQQSHQIACQFFSIVTLAFHVFFLAWLVRRLFGADMWWFVGIGTYFWTAMRREKPHWIAVPTTMVCSLSAAIILLQHNLIPHLPPHVAPSSDLIWLAVVCGFGLMLCPYLDLTFHQARQATSPADGRWAFALGFGVVFLAMLLFSLAYSGWMLDPVPALPLRVASLLGLHLLIQSILKLVLHVRALKMRRNIAVLGSGIILILAAAVLGAYCRDTPATYRGITLGEIAYRSFMAFYGLVFPAYVWICVFNKRNVNLWLAAIAIAAPMYWMGFIERRTIWLLPGVAVALLAPLIAPARQTPIAKADG